MTRSALRQPKLAVLWSVAVARLVLSAAAVLAAPTLLQELSFEAAADFAGFEGSLAGPRSWAAAAALVVLWLGLEVFARTDPRWRSWVRRRRHITGERAQPGLATVPLSFLTGAGAGLVAVAAGHLLVGTGDFVGGDLTGGAVAPTTSELTAFALLALWLLVVAGADSAGQTACAAGAAGLAAGVASVYVDALSSVVLTITAWPLLLLVVALLVVLRPVDDVRRRLQTSAGRAWRRWVRRGGDASAVVRGRADLRGAPTTRR